MKYIASILLVLALTILAIPASAKTYVHQFRNADGHIMELEYSQWSQAKCQTYLTHKKSHKRRFVDHCIGRVSKGTYAKIYEDMMHAYKDAKDKRIQLIKKKGMLALLHPDVRWLKPSDQKILDDLKLAGIIMGGIIGASSVIGYGIGAVFGGVSTLGFMGYLPVVLYTM